MIIVHKKKLKLMREIRGHKRGLVSSEKYLFYNECRCLKFSILEVPLYMLFLLLFTTVGAKHQTQ